MASFLEWYVLERPLAGIGLTPVACALEEGAALPADERRGAGRAGDQPPQPVRAVRTSRTQMLDVEDLIGGARFAVRERRKPLGMTAGDLFEARLVWDGETVVFGRTFLFHPPDAREVVLEWIAARRRDRRGARGDPVSPVAPAHPLAPARTRGGRQGLSGCLRRPPGAAGRARSMARGGGGGRPGVRHGGERLPDRPRRERGDRSNVDAAPARPYAIVLGNRVFPDGTPCAGAAARLETALALYRAGRAAKLVVSGGVRRAPTTSRGRWRPGWRRAASRRPTCRGPGRPPHGGDDGGRGGAGGALGPGRDAGLSPAAIALPGAPRGDRRASVSRRRTGAGLGGLTQRFSAGDARRGRRSCSRLRPRRELSHRAPGARCKWGGAWLENRACDARPWP